MLVVGFVVVLDYPELQIQARDSGGEERRIQYAGAYVEAHELQVSGVRIARRDGVSEVRGVAEGRCFEGEAVAEASGVGEEAGGDALGNERRAVAESQGGGG